MGKHRTHLFSQVIFVVHSFSIPFVFVVGMAVTFATVPLFVTSGEKVFSESLSADDSARDSAKLGGLH